MQASIANQSAANVTAEQAHALAMSTFSAVTSSLTTTDKKGKVRDFTSSVAFASKDGRWEMAATLWLNQAKAGRFGALIFAALDEGVVTKAQADVFRAILPRNPNKDEARMVCRAVRTFADLAISNGKAAKGKKQYLINLIGALSVHIGEADTTAADAARTIQG